VEKIKEGLIHVDVDSKLFVVLQFQRNIKFVKF
jgi:hypothetical protein